MAGKPEKLFSETGLNKESRTKKITGRIVPVDTFSLIAKITEKSVNTKVYHKAPQVGFMRGSLRGPCGYFSYCWWSL